MQALVPYGQSALKLKEYDQLPPHITRRDYQDFLDAIERRYANPGMVGERLEALGVERLTGLAENGIIP